MQMGSMKEGGSTEVSALRASVGPTSGRATAFTTAHKYRRALKNGTGAHLTLADCSCSRSWRIGSRDPCRK